MDISVNVHYFKLKFRVCHHNNLLEESVSQNFDFDLGPSFHFMSKKGNFWIFLSFVNFYISYWKTVYFVYNDSDNAYTIAIFMQL